MSVRQVLFVEEKPENVRIVNITQKLKKHLENGMLVSTENSPYIISKDNNLSCSRNIFKNIDNLKLIVLILDFIMVQL